MKIKDIIGDRKLIEIKEECPICHNEYSYSIFDISKSGIRPTPIPNSIGYVKCPYCRACKTVSLETLHQLLGNS